MLKLNLTPKVYFSRDTRLYDGYLLGDGGTPVSPDSPLPTPIGADGDDFVFYVNGINTNIGKQLFDMRNIANTGRRVVGIHNATAGIARDLTECIGDKANVGDNPAVTTVKNLLRRSLASNISISLIGHSQGALVCSRALWELSDELHGEGLSETDVAKELSSVRLETAGGAAYTYPEGPSYHHVVNQFDAVPMVAGVGLDFSEKEPGEVIERVQRFQRPYIREGEPLRDLIPNAVDRSVHGTEVYYRSEKSKSCPGPSKKQS